MDSRASQASASERSSTSAGLSLTGGCLVRTASLPFSAILEWAGTSTDDSFEAANAHLLALFSTERGELTLRLASGPLYRQVCALRDGLPVETKRLAKLHNSLAKYFLRWGSRATPFGLFTNVAATRPGQPPPTPAVRYWLQASQELVEKLWRSSLPARPPCYENPTIHTLGTRSYFFVHNSTSGIYSLRSVLTDGGGVEAAIEDGLMTELRTPQAVGPPPLDQLADLLEQPTNHLAAIRSHERSYESIAELRTAIDQMEALSGSIPEGAHNSAPANNANWPVANVTALGCHLSAPRIAEVMRQVESHLPMLLDVLWHPRNSKADEIHRVLRETFEEEPIPLLEFASQILWPRERAVRRGATADETAGNSTHRSAAFHRWAFEAIERSGCKGDLCLTLADIETLRTGSRQVAGGQSGYVLGSAALVNGQSRLLVRNIVGPTALSMLGRFSLASPDIAGCAVAIAQQEQLSTRGVVCDVSFVPSFRAVNVVSRPPLREAWIALDGPGCSGTPHPLDLRRLYVASFDGRLALFSEELNCRVHPRISCAFNQRLMNDAVFQILAAIQNHEDNLSCLWNWGLQALRPFTPRVCYQDLVLCPASWRLSLDEECKSALRKQEEADRSRFVKQLRQRHHLPRLVSHGRFDQQLVYDLDNARCRALLAEVLLKESHLRLDEAYPPDGEFANEIAVFFCTTTAVDNPGPLEAPASSKPILTGSAVRNGIARSWASFEVYAQPEDFTLVIEACAAAAARLRRDGAAKRWFYVCHNDPSPHIRYRIEVDHSRTATLADVAAEVHRTFESFAARGCIQQVRTTTYRPEMQRYGGAELIGYAHQLFWHDSELQAALRPHLQVSDSTTASVDACCLYLDRILDSLGIKMEQRGRMAREFAAAFTREFPGTDPQIWAEEYRLQKSRLLPLLAGESAGGFAEECRLLLRIASLEAGFVANEYRERTEAAHGPGKWQTILWSLLHMHVNRSFSEDWRRQELRCYELLSRAYRQLRHFTEPKTKSAAFNGV